MRTRTVTDSYSTAAWGLLLIWWGFRWLVDFLPNGTGLVGTGLILLGLNALRWLNALPTRWHTTLLGLLALTLGAVLLVEPVLNLPFELPVFAILLVAAGAIVLAREFLRTRRSHADTPRLCC